MTRFYCLCDKWRYKIGVEGHVLPYGWLQRLNWLLSQFPHLFFKPWLEASFRFRQMTKALIAILTNTVIYRVTGVFGFCLLLHLFFQGTLFNFFNWYYRQTTFSFFVCVWLVIVVRKEAILLGDLDWFHQKIHPFWVAKLWSLSSILRSNSSRESAASTLHLLRTHNWLLGCYCELGIHSLFVSNNWFLQQLCDICNRSWLVYFVRWVHPTSCDWNRLHSNRCASLSFVCLRCLDVHRNT